MWPYGGINMGDVRLATGIDPRLSFEVYSDHRLSPSHVQIYSLERYIPFYSKQTFCTEFVELFVGFINGRPMSAPELVLENDTGVVYKSNQILREGGVIHWNLDTFVPFRYRHSQKLIDSVQIC